MLKEILHFAFHASGTITLKRKLSQAELYETLVQRSEKAGMAQWRSSLVETVKGDVLEIGCGTGIMFEHYRNRVRLAAIEFDPEFLEIAKGRAESSPHRILLSLSDGQVLPFSDAAFDYVVIALVLCSVPSIEAVLSEVYRVLKPRGELRLIEHVRSHRQLSGRVMDVLNPLWLKLNGQGCNMNRNTEFLLEQNGFNLKEVKRFKIFTAGTPTFPKRWIRAAPNVRESNN